MTWTTEPASRGSGLQYDGHAERPAVEDDALLDHHLEEMLGTFSDAERMRETGVDDEEQRLN